MSGDTHLKKSKKLNRSVQLAFSQTISLLDALYVTRIQMERRNDKDATQSWINIVDTVNKELLSKAKDNTIVMHPLPRRNELSYDIDQDKRAAYFKQAEYGVPIRMALITAVLGLADFELEVVEKGRRIFDDKKCDNPNCITVNQENIQNKYVKANGMTNLYRCVYCDQEQEVKGKGDS